MLSDINKGLICPYCNSKTEYIDSKYIYGTSYGMIYICKPCDAYVGVHKGTDNALGRLADKRLRKAKKDAHYFFDKIARTGLAMIVGKEFTEIKSPRNKAYAWMAKELNLPIELTHIGMFDVETCMKVESISINKLLELEEKQRYGS
jgi:DNA-directed RNA polymerase subunit RPC12/RpoP